jgi:hypothetical protein
LEVCWSLNYGDEYSGVMMGFINEGWLLLWMLTLAFLFVSQSPRTSLTCGRLRILSQNSPVGGRKKILRATPRESAGHCVSEEGGTSVPGVEALGHVSMNDAVDHALSRLHLPQ